MTFRVPAMLFLLACALVAHAQTPDHATLVDRVYAYAHAYRDRLPSLEAEATIISEKIENNRVTRTATLLTLLRELRDPDRPGQFVDYYKHLQFNGRPFHRGMRTDMPYFVHSGFSNGIGLAGAQNPTCLRYILEPVDSTLVRLTIVPRPDAPSACATEQQGLLRKQVTFEAATGIVHHVERDIDPLYAFQHHEVAHATLDCAPVLLGDEQLWLPVRIEASDTLRHGHMIATYTNFHRYASSARLVDDAAPLSQP